MQNKKEDKALVMYMLVCSRTNDRMTDEELTDCSLANLKVGDIFTPTATISTPWKTTKRV